MASPDDDFDESDDDGWDPDPAEKATMLHGRPQCPACGDSLFVPDAYDDTLVMCVRDATSIRLPRPWSKYR